MHGADDVTAAKVDWRLRFPELYGLVANYLHEDWHLDYDTPTAALDDGIRSYTDEDLRSLLEEIDDLLALRLGERELEHVLDRLGNYYEATADGTYGQWLNDVAIQFRKAVEARTRDVPLDDGGR